MKKQHKLRLFSGVFAAVLILGLVLNTILVNGRNLEDSADGFQNDSQQAGEYNALGYVSDVTNDEPSTEVKSVRMDGKSTKDEDAADVAQAMPGVYLSGEGNNGATGLDPDNPVKTLDKANELLDLNPDLDTIYIMDKVTITGIRQLTLDGRRLARYTEYKGILIEVANGATLTLKDVVVDGSCSGGIDDVRSLVKVDKGGTLNILEGAVIQNNDVAGYKTNYAGDLSGGGVNSSGTVVLDGGVIQNCSAVNGGGIYCDGGTFRMESGIICNNINDKAMNDISVGYIPPSGGGVMINGSAVMTMNGGTITGNRSYNGGGIALGGWWYTMPSVAGLMSTADSFIMNGGSIEDNTAYACGGGLYVHNYFNGTINCGTISCNTSKGYGAFGGGGIYVNGGKNTGNGKLTLYNVVISDNTANLEGGGIAGCYTSDTELHADDGAVIFDNTAGDGKDDILISCSNGSGDVLSSKTEKSITEVMLGGGLYDWEYTGTDDIVDSNKLSGDGNVSIYTEKSGDDLEVELGISMAQVFITNNVSLSRGGGIGSSGDLIIGAAG